jgi:hypothetical protein
MLQVVDALADLRRAHNENHLSGLGAAELCTLVSPGIANFTETAPASNADESNHEDEKEETSVVSLKSKADVLEYAIKLISKEMEWAKSLAWTKKGLQ